MAPMVPCEYRSVDTRSQKNSLTLSNSYYGREHRLLSRRRLRLHDSSSASSTRASILKLLLSLPLHAPFSLNSEIACVERASRHSRAGLGRGTARCAKRKHKSQNLTRMSSSDIVTQRCALAKSSMCSCEMMLALTSPSSSTAGIAALANRTADSFCICSRRWRGEPMEALDALEALSTTQNTHRHILTTINSVRLTETRHEWIACVRTASQHANSSHRHSRN